jgi:hypothetical protein
MKPTCKLEKLVTKLFNLMPVLPGSVNTRYRICGKPNCRCQDKDNPRKHLAYQLNYCLASKNGTMYLKKSEVDRASEMTSNYKEFRAIYSAIASEMVQLSKTHGVAESYKMMLNVFESVRSKAAGNKHISRSMREIITSRDAWKETAVERQKQLDKTRVTIRDLTKSRAKWRQKASILKNESKAQEQIIKEQHKHIKDLESCQVTAAKKK